MKLSYIQEFGKGEHNSSEYFLHTIWDKVFKNGPSKIFGRQPLKNIKGYGQSDHTQNRPYTFKFFKGCLP